MAMPATARPPRGRGSNMAADAARYHCIENQRVPNAGAGAHANTARTRRVHGQWRGRTPRLVVRLWRSWSAPATITSGKATRPLSDGNNPSPVLTIAAVNATYGTCMAMRNKRAWRAVRFSWPIGRASDMALIAGPPAMARSFAAQPTVARPALRDRSRRAPARSARVSHRSAHRKQPIESPAELARRPRRGDGRWRSPVWLRHPPSRAASAPHRVRRGLKPVGSHRSVVEHRPARVAIVRPASSTRSPRRLRPCRPTPTRGSNGPRWRRGQDRVHDAIQPRYVADRARPPDRGTRGGRHQVADMPRPTRAV